MDKITYLGLIFIIVIFFGFYLSYLYGRKTKNFRWSEYFALLLWPMLFVIGFAYLIDKKMLGLFFVSAFAGFILEYIFGLAYYKTLNRRLWTYNRLTIGGHSSLLAIPLFTNTMRSS